MTDPTAPDAGSGPPSQDTREALADVIHAHRCEGTRSCDQAADAILARFAVTPCEAPTGAGWVIAQIPRREWDESDADSIAANSARAYNHGLLVAQQAVEAAQAPTGATPVQLQIHRMLMALHPEDFTVTWPENQGDASA